MNLLFIGDVVGKNGCAFIRQKLPTIKNKYQIDITVINGENSAQGNGISKESADELLNYGADIITTGNHAFKKKDAYDIFQKSTILRPANYPEGCIGTGVCTLDFGGFTVAIVNLMGTVFMEPLDNPFFCIDNILKDINTKNIFLDFHAEASAEKKAMGHYLSTRVTAVLGTHTHVQTSDEIILENHTAYITDVGMTGPELSILGVQTAEAIKKLKYKTPFKFYESNSPCFLNAVVVNFDTKTGKSLKIERLVVR